MGKNVELIKEKYDFKDLQNIVTALRAPDGCPWDRALVHESIEQPLLEECDEVIQAVREKDLENLCEELGDVLLQILFHCEIAKENGEFTFDDVINGIAAKLVRRHPNVFYTEDREQESMSSIEGLQRWEAVKAKEKEGTHWTPELELRRVPEVMPPVLRTRKVLKKAAKLYGAGNIAPKDMEELNILMQQCDEADSALINRLEIFIEDMAKKK